MYYHVFPLGLLARLKAMTIVEPGGWYDKVDQALLRVEGVTLKFTNNHPHLIILTLHTGGHNCFRLKKSST